MEFFVDPEVRLERSGVTASTQLVRVLIPVVLQQRKLLSNTTKISQNVDRIM
jgi:hypothetical protein